MTQLKSAPAGAVNQPAPSVPSIGLVLTGGGARAAYQVGVLEGIVEIRRQAGLASSCNPFSIITGTSAGAINAAALACGADDFGSIVESMTKVWREFKVEQVYRIDSISMLDAAQRWRFLVGVCRFVISCLRVHPRSFLDNSPLAELIKRLVPFHRLPRLLHQGHLQALAVTASSYGTGENVTFFQCDHRVSPWVRNLRAAVPTQIDLEHVMASSAIPFIFPANNLPSANRGDYFGDGSMRQTAPLAPAIHLGARRVLAIGAGRKIEPRNLGNPGPPVIPGYPSLAQVAGHALSSIFLDTLLVDVERVRRINRTLQLISPEHRAESQLHHIDLLVMLPSQSIDEIAARHVHHLPGAIRRTLLGGRTTNAPNEKAASFASYLLFERAFTSELMELGRSDALARREELSEFLANAPRPDEPMNG
jgi:NTE family protein